ncbi:Short-chain dehydrogenase reductase sdr [Lasiodiplodia theobromae]|uniref:Short-chain dehydrogenase reductase sdr n=1 Tax=Lasiodiplodia theobromae TaxID=45133 RepID=UPI0015C3BA8B|nr:Short-chain dehydrogenase reductase sdr [Lasiodiplodia theobromae]KAF4546060.1 Short-chain dehydrogenase reductase sdr [Lasiodiplodia theobromae]
MPLFQPTLHAPPDEPTLEGHTIIITGSNSGIGLETARQLLLRRASTVILAVRNIHKGELAKASLLSDPAVRQHANPAATVAVMELDMADYDSVAHFAAAVTATLPELHLLVLNAGCGGVGDAGGKKKSSVVERNSSESSASSSNGGGSSSVGGSSSTSSSGGGGSGGGGGGERRRGGEAEGEGGGGGGARVGGGAENNHNNSNSRHERTLQVNYLSNVLLLLALLPLLRATAALCGRPSRVTWTGSRAHALTARTSVAHLPPFRPGDSVLGRLDQAAAEVDYYHHRGQRRRGRRCSLPGGGSRHRHPQQREEENEEGARKGEKGGAGGGKRLQQWRHYFDPFTRYADSKLLAVFFLYELRRRLGVLEDGEAEGGGVVVNMFCPGMVDTRIGDALPWYLRLPWNAMKVLQARSVEQAGWVAVHAAVVAGEESHGRFLGDMEVFEETDFIKSEDGRKIQAMLWEETVAEMSKLMEVPEWMRTGGGSEHEIVSEKNLMMQADMSDR